MTKSCKADFPIFSHNPGLIYLDSAASAQKPTYVIDNLSKFFETSYANIHRGSYGLSEKSEEIYYKSKEKIGSLLGFSADEIIYTYNATYAYNLIAQTLQTSQFLQAGDKILIDIAEHHANIVPRQMLSQQYGIEVERIDLTEKFDYNIEDFKKKYTDRVKVVSLSTASNVTGVLYNLNEIASLLRKSTFFIVDASQALPHLNIAKYTCNPRIDAIIATGHKMMSDTGIGILGLRKHYIKIFTPARGGGGMIEDVSKSGFTTTTGREKFEPGTPHIAGAASLLYASEYLQNIGYEALQAHEQQLTEYMLTRFAQNPKLQLFGPNLQDFTTNKNRLGICSFAIQGQTNHQKIGELLAEKNICIRAGGHCTHPLFRALQQNGSCRISTYLYNDIEDVEKTFDLLDELSKEL